MTPDTLKRGLEMWTEPQFDPVQYSRTIDIVTNGKARRIDLPWFHVAKLALGYIEELEVIVQDWKATQEGKGYFRVLYRLSELERENRELRVRNDNQAADIKRLTAEKGKRA